MIEPTNIDLIIYQGATFRRKWSITKASDGSPYSMISWTARMQIRAKKKDDDFLLELTTTETDEGVITLENTVDESTITIYISPETTAALTSGGVYDLELVDTGGDVVRIMEGKVTLSLEVTR